MEFKFSVNELFKQPIVELNQNLIPPGFSGDRRALWDTVNKVSEVINAMGEASAKAQGLSKPITTADRLRNSEHRLYLLVDQQANSGKGAVTGMLKTGSKGLYVFDREGQHYQVSPPCVLDFYVHDTRQRTGLGKRLFEHMLQKEGIEPVKMAIDRPSEKLLGFLNKHYGLHSPVKQMNNYVVYDGFFPKASDNNQQQEIERDQSPSGTRVTKKDSANGLQSFSSAYGRYGAPRPPCSMGQIIHNQSSTINKQQEPSGVQSMPLMGQPPQQYGYTQNQNVTQSLPNIHQAQMSSHPNYPQTQIAQNYQMNEQYANPQAINAQYAHMNQNQYTMQSTLQNPKQMQQISEDVYVYQQPANQQQCYQQGQQVQYQTNQTFGQGDAQYPSSTMQQPHALSNAQQALYQNNQMMQGEPQYVQQQPLQNQLMHQQMQESKLMQQQYQPTQQVYIPSHVSQSAPQLPSHAYNQGVQPVQASSVHLNHGPVSNLQVAGDHAQQQVHQTVSRSASAYNQHQVAQDLQNTDQMQSPNTIMEQQNLQHVSQTTSAFNQQQIAQQMQNQLGVQIQQPINASNQHQVQTPSSTMYQPTVQHTGSTFNQHPVAQQMQNQQIQPSALSTDQVMQQQSMQQPVSRPQSAFHQHQVAQQIQPSAPSTDQVMPQQTMQQTISRPPSAFNQQQVAQPSVQSINQNDADVRSEMSLIMTGEQYEPGKRQQPVVHQQPASMVQHQHGNVANDTNVIQQQGNLNQHQSNLHQHISHQAMAAAPSNVNVNIAQQQMAQQVPSNMLQQPSVSMHAPLNQSMMALQQQPVVQPQVVPVSSSMQHGQNLSMSGVKSEQVIRSNLPMHTVSTPSVRDAMLGNAGYLKETALAGGDMKQSSNKPRSTWNDDDSLRYGYPPQVSTAKYSGTY
ncbi:unnamed protein product [Callosobruchus maculatus]|uniref:Alpha-tubulin N-acetyltransferase n=1 Tax=Callosobruchus maculatus TaxID=64391 RepID=A0A653DH68_CALMS|nr:unnamed protein product [Callosobruchus maculatus]